MSRVREGGCHCGTVRFRVRLADDQKALRCNCTICAMSGFMHLIVPEADFELLQGRQVLQEYRFNTRTARHLFCSRCGVKSFYIPRSHPDCVSVNRHCLDGAERLTFPVQAFAGADWERNIEQIRGDKGR